MVKTSLKLPRALWRKAHLEALERGLDLQDVVGEALAFYFRHRPAKKAGKAR